MSETYFVVNGFRYGFLIGYEGDKSRQSKVSNLKLQCGNKYDLWQKILKEVKLGHFVGPFEEIPYENYIQSPIAVDISLILS